MAFRARLFKWLAIGLFLLMLLDLATLLIPNAGEIWKWVTGQVEGVVLAISAKDMITFGLVWGIGLSVLILFVLLAWRNRAGVLAEDRHRQMMTALKAIYQALSKP